MKFCSLGSGSEGNCTVVSAGDTHIMIDCGFSLKDVAARAETRQIDFDLNELDGLFITHEHLDHAGGAARMARKYGVPLYMTTGTARKVRDLKGAEIRIISTGVTVEFTDLSIEPFTVPHDAAEPVQFIVRTQKAENKLGVISDLGHITPAVVEALHDCDALLLEANHDWHMLQNGPYPLSLKERVGGDWGHLNNQQSASLLSKIRKENLRCLVATHLSQKNNSPEAVRQSWSQVEGVDADQIIMADQDGGFDWQMLNSTN